MQIDATPSNGRSSATAWLLRLLVYPMFFASGAAGLIYEVTWTRQLLYTFGASLYAICSVLAAFMAGLALGSWLLGRVSDRLRRPLATYGVLELAIGFCGLAIPLLLDRLYLVDGWAYRHWGQNFTVLTGFRFILALAVMLLPTTLMGATLPVLTRFFVHERRHLGLHVGGLYATNTFGAVCGAFLAGFFLIASLGLYHTQWTAAGLNLLVAVLSLVLSPLLDRPAQQGVKAASRAAQTEEPAVDPSIYRWILFTAMCSGMVALCAQVIWSRSLVFSFEYLKNTTYAFSAMLTVFLAGLALGSAVIGPLIDHQRFPLRLYGILLMLIGISIAVSVVVAVSGAEAMLWATPYNEETGELNWSLAVLNIMLQTFGVVGIPTLLMGMAFPVAARVITRVGHVGGDVGTLYSVNTLGSIVGSLAAAVVIVPLFGLTKGLLLLGVIEIALGLATIARSPAGRMHLRLFGGLAVFVLVPIGFWLARGEGARLQPLVNNDVAMRFYDEGALATVAVAENSLGDRTIYVDGVGVAGTDQVLQTDQKSLAHLPMMLLERPTSALTVGFGSGGASYSLLLHDRLTTVHCVEICPNVLDAAPTLDAANHRFYGDLHPLEFAARDDRYEIIIDDARAWLRYTDQRYDFIATDCTDLRYKSNANLYDVEYFQACRDRLTPEGIVCVWMPLAGLSDDVFRVALNSFYQVFPEMGVFFMNNEPTHYILLIGWQDRIRLDYRLFERTLAEADVRQDLAEIYLDDPVKLLSCFITGGEAVARYIGDARLNTAQHPVIEFESPKYGFGDQPLIDNLEALMQHYVSPVEFLEPGSIPAEQRERLERYCEALPYVIEGHAHYRNVRGGDFLTAMEQATRAWMRAAEIAPEDQSLRYRLRFQVLSRRMAGEPNQPIWPLLLGRVYMIQDDRSKWDLAYDALTQAVRLLDERIPRAEGTMREIMVNQRNMATQWIEELRERVRQ